MSHLFAGRAPRPDVDWDGWKYSWRDDRFNMFLSHLQFHMIPNFTEVGFHKTKIPVSMFGHDVPKCEVVLFFLLNKWVCVNMLSNTLNSSGFKSVIDIDIDSIKVD